MKLEDLRNPVALASMERAGWEYDEKLGALFNVVERGRLPGEDTLTVFVSLEIAESAAAGFDVLHWEYCRAAGLPEPGGRSDGPWRPVNRQGA